LGRPPSDHRSLLIAVRPVWKIDQMSTLSTTAAAAMPLIQTTASGHSSAAITTSTPPLFDSTIFLNTVH
jgi:hypothetical protein